MRVSVWQQFSSNHSAGFTVVGRFASGEEANKAAEEFQKLIQASHQWLVDSRLRQKDTIENVAPDSQDTLPEPEREFSEKYQVEWHPYGIDWLEGSYDLTELVKVVHTDVFVTTNTYESAWLPVPIVTAMAKMGARSVGSERDDSRIGFLTCLDVELSCAAPDRQIAARVASTVVKSLEWAITQNDFSREFEMSRPDMPWIPDGLDELGSLGYEIVGGFRSAVKQQANRMSCFIQFSQTGVGLPAFVGWLGTLGCTEIQYRLREGRQISWQEI